MEEHGQEFVLGTRSVRYAEARQCEGKEKGGGLVPGQWEPGQGAGVLEELCGSQPSRSQRETWERLGSREKAGGWDKLSAQTTDHCLGSVLLCPPTACNRSAAQVSEDPSTQTLVRCPKLPAMSELKNMRHDGNVHRHVAS